MCSWTPCTERQTFTLLHHWRHKFIVMITCIFLAQGSRLWTIFIIVAKTSMARSRSRSRSRSVRPTESDPADEEEQEAFEFDPLVAVEDPGSEEEKALWNNWFSALAQDLWISRFLGGTFMQTLGRALLCKRWGGHFYANVGVDTFTQTLGWTLLRKHWGGHFHANVGVGTLMQTLRWTLSCRRSEVTG